MPNKLLKVKKELYFNKKTTYTFYNQISLFTLLSIR